MCADRGPSHLDALAGLVEHLAMLQVFGLQRLTAGEQRGDDNERIPVGTLRVDDDIGTSEGSYRSSRWVFRRFEPTAILGKRS
jgi:hypothetical protein